MAQTTKKPEPGEIWVNAPPLEREAIIAKVDGQNGTIVVVSLTGTQCRVSQKSFFLTWNFRRKPFDTGRICSRYKCENPAIVAYDRILIPDPEFACSHHIPRGVCSRFIKPEVVEPLKRLLAPPASVVDLQCENCKGDTTEVLGVLPIHFKGTMWNCQACGLWWIRAFLDRKDWVGNPTSDLQIPFTVSSTSPGGLPFMVSDPYFDLPGYTRQRIVMWGDSLEDRLHFRIYVVPEAGTYLKEQNLTLYDYVKLDDL